MGMLIHKHRMERLRKLAEPKEDAKAKLKQLGHKKGKKGRRTKAEVAEQERLAKVAYGTDG